MTYSIVGILAAVILVIINRDVLWMQDKTAAKSTTIAYRRFLMGVMLYYITDLLWGIIESYRLSGLLYADTFIHFIAMAAAVMLWTRYAVSYLEEKNAFGTFLNRAGTVFLVAQVIVLIINLFRPFMFWLDEEGAYHA